MRSFKVAVPEDLDDWLSARAALLSVGREGLVLELIESARRVSTLDADERLCLKCIFSASDSPLFVISVEDLWAEWSRAQLSADNHHLGNVTDELVRRGLVAPAEGPSFQLTKAGRSACQTLGLVARPI